MREHHKESDDADLKHLAGREDRVAVSVSAEHAAQDSGGDGEIGRAEKDPGDTDGGVGDKAEQNFHRESVGPCLFPDERTQGVFDHQIETVQ